MPLFPKGATMISIILCFIKLLFQSKRSLLLQNLALRQQISVYKQTIKRPKTTFKDKLFWVFISKYFSGWKDVLAIVKPDTVIKWRRTLFKQFWKFKSKYKGRRRIPPEIRNLIKKLRLENPLWGASRIYDELTLLRFDICLTSVKNYLKRFGPRLKPFTSNWLTFLKNHMKNTSAVDFFTIPTINFRILYCFIVLSHDRRKIIHFNVTNHPHQFWTVQQIRNAFPNDTAPKYLIRDRDSIYGNYFKTSVKNFGIKQIPTGFKSPWQNPYCERVIGSIRRECLNYMIIFNEKHLRKTLAKYIHYYNNIRPHQSLNGNSPNGRKTQTIHDGQINSRKILNGLHHHYFRKAA